MSHSCAHIVVCLLLAAAGPARPEIIDRIAVSVDDQLITQSDLMREIRITAFINGEKPDFSAENKRKTAQRLIEQLLLRRDMELTRFPAPPESEVDRMMRVVRQSRFRNEAHYRAELAAYGITEQELREQLRRQAAVLRYIEFRFRPEVQLTEAEIRNYYENRILPELRKRGVSPQPSYDEARSQAEDALAAQRADELVDKWLVEARNRVRIRYREEVFQ